MTYLEEDFTEEVYRKDLELQAELEKDAGKKTEDAANE